MVLHDCHINITLDCYRFTKSFQKSVHVPCFCRVYTNYSSHFILEKYCKVCIQVLRGLTDFHPYTTPRNFMHKQFFFREDHSPLGWRVSGPSPCRQSRCREHHERTCFVTLRFLKGTVTQRSPWGSCGDQMLLWTMWLRSSREAGGRNALHSAVCVQGTPVKFSEPLRNQFCLKYFQNFSPPFQHARRTTVTPAREQREGQSVQWLSTLIEKTRGCCSNCPERLERKQDSMLTA